MSNFDRFRKTFENINESFTSDDPTEQSKSEYTSEKSYCESQSPYLPCLGSKSDISCDPIEINLQQYVTHLTRIQESLFAEVESLKSEKKSLINENIQLKARHKDLEKQVEFLSEKLKKKEKELNKFLHEKETLLKAEEDSKRLIEDLKSQHDQLAKENQEYKKNLEGFRTEKRKLVRTLKESELKTEVFQRSLRKKEESVDIQQVKSRPEHQSQKLKSQSSKFSLNFLDIEKRGSSDSPERKTGQLSERAEEPYRVLYLEAKKLLGVTSSFDLREKILKLKETHVKYLKTQKFISKISNMLVQISPTGSFEKEPSTRQIWKWLTRFLEEYMKIKQSVNGESFKQLCSLLGACSIDEMIDKVILLQRGRSSLRMN